MSRPMIQVENVSKQYRLGEISTGALAHDLNRWWHRIRNKPDPYLKVTQTNRRDRANAGKASPDRPRAGAGDEYVWALRNVNFEVGRGEVLGIIGSNGAGKSTLLKLLSRVTAPTAGEIRMDGSSSALLEVGTGFHPDLTGRENIFLNGAILGMSKAEIRGKFDQIVEFSGCGAYIDTPVKRYSSGMYVRLAFAVAAHLEPDILIVDEVLAVGDAEFQKKCIGKMQDVAGHGRTVLFVSHNMAAVSQICGRVLLMDRGEVAFDGDTIAGVQRYLSTAGNPVPERAWAVAAERPGDDRVRLAAVRVLQDGALAAGVDINREVSLEMEFDVLNPVRSLILGVQFHDAEGLCLFAHCDWNAASLGVGRYRKTAIVPPQRFAEGRVSVLVQLVHDAPPRQVVAANAVSFEAHDSAQPDRVRGPYQGRWPGVVRLPLQWNGFERLPGDSHE